MIFGIEQYLMKKGWGGTGKRRRRGVKVLKICRMSLDRYSILCIYGYGGAGGGGGSSGFGSEIVLFVFWERSRLIYH